jgi:hypothetical protein
MERNALKSSLPLRGGLGWADEKLGFHRHCIRAVFIAPPRQRCVCFAPCNGGVRGVVLTQPITAVQTISGHRSDYLICSPLLLLPQCGQAGHPFTILAACVPTPLSPPSNKGGRGIRDAVVMPGATKTRGPQSHPRASQHQVFIGPPPTLPRKGEGGRPRNGSDPEFSRPGRGQHSLITKRALS